MKKYKIRINKLEFINNNLIIISEDGNKFIGIIKKGSVNFKIFNESKQELHLGNLLEDSLITVYGSIDKNNEQIKEEKNNIIIKKIKIRNMYIFNSDSSDEFEDYY